MFPKMVDMSLTEEQKQEMVSPIMNMGDLPKFPYGLSLCLTHEELEKLDLDSDCEVGDYIHLFALAKVTSISKNDTGDGEKCRVELQITHLGVESEDEENEESDMMEPHHPYY